MTSKRAKRRARGRRIEARPPYSSAALAMAAAFKTDAERAAAFRPFAERLEADFVRQVEAILPFVERLEADFVRQVEAILLWLTPQHQRP